ncbi:MAG: sensor histidine kinase, partial [Verrucomicrobiae bacterium]|nr:sensor histidine kinase [Verrucomicrobiae bacterium]
MRAEGTRRLEARRRLALERQLVDMVDQYGTNLGRELHDDLGQQLTGLAFLAKTAERKLAAAGSRQAGDLRRIAELLRAALEKVRDLARGILPMHLHEGSLSPPLAELAERTRATYRRRCEFRGRNVGLKLDPEVALHLYRIAQEAVNNAVKHSRAREITIALRRRGAFLSVSVGDNGVGLPNAASEFTGLGMAILEQRAATIGATLSVHSRPGRGTLVKVSL